MTGGIVGKHVRSRRGSDAGLLQQQLGESHDSKHPPLPVASSRRNCISGGFPGPKARPSVIFSSQKLGVTVGGCAAFYSAVLSCAPEHAVTVSLVNLPPCLRVSPSLVVFSSENWMVPQFFRVAVLTTVYDDSNKDDRKLQVLEHVSSSADARFSGNRIMFLPCNVLVQVSSREGCYLFASGAAGATVLEPPKPVESYPTLREFAQVELGASRSQSATASGTGNSSSGRDASLTVARSSVLSNQSFSSAAAPSGVDAMNALAHAALAAKRMSTRRNLLANSPSSASLAPSIQSSADAYYHSSLRDGVAVVKVVARAEHTLVLYKTGKSGLFGAMAVDYSTEERTTGDVVGANGSRGSNAALSRMLVDIDCGDAHVVALTEQGYVLTWGDGADGRLGHGSASSFRGPHAIRSLFHKRIVQLACGAQHTVVVADDGDVYSWGYGKCGALGHGRSEREQSFDSVAMPMEVLALKHRSVARVACGDAHTAVVLTNGVLLTCGWSAYGRLGRTVPNEFTSVLERVATGALASPTALVTFVACGAAHTLTLTESKALVAFGWNAHGQLGLGDRRNRAVPTVLQYFDADDLVLTAVSAGKLHSMALTQDARVFAWGSDELGQCGIGAFPQIYTVPHLVPSCVGMNATQVSAGTSHSVVLTTASHKQLDAMQTNHPTRYAALQESYELFVRSDAAQRAKVLAFAKDAQSARELAARKRKPRVDPSLSLAKTLQLQSRLERDLENAHLGDASSSGQRARARPRTAGAVLLRSSGESKVSSSSAESKSAAPAPAAALSAAREQKVRCSSATLWRQTRLFTFQSPPPQQSTASPSPSSAIRAPNSARAAATGAGATGASSGKSRPMSANPGASLQSVQLSTEARQSLARMLNGDSHAQELQQRQRDEDICGAGDKKQQNDLAHEVTPLHARFPVSRPKSAPSHAARQQQHVRAETAGVRLRERHGLERPSRVLQDDRVVLLCGATRRQVQAAEDELLALFASLPADLRRRVRVAKSGRLHRWAFVPTCRTSDRTGVEINLLDHPYELMRVQRCVRDHAAVDADDLLVDLDDYWSDSEYAVPRSDDTSMRVFAVIGGAALYAPSSAIDLEREYAWHELVRLHNPVDVHSRWSDVCDVEHSRPLWLLLTALFAVAEPQPQTRLKMHFYSTESAGSGCQLTYALENGAWVLQKSGELAVASAIHDISLANDVGVRLIASPRKSALRHEWRSLAQRVIPATANSSDDVYRSAAAVNASTLPQGLVVRASHVAIEEKWVVSSQSVLGLRFTVARFSEKWVMKASLPSEERPANVREHFARLRLRLLHVLSIYEDKASISASTATAASSF